MVRLMIQDTASSIVSKITFVFNLPFILTCMCLTDNSFYTGSDTSSNLLGLEQWQEAMVLGVTCLIIVVFCTGICLVIR